MANEPNYSSNPSKDEPKKEKVRVIPLEYIDEFPGHPFKVLDDESMQKLMNSIEEIGVQSPIVARIKEDQRYEIISGHRRVHACRRLGLKLIPAIVRDLSRDEAIIAMVDANLQREHILPSEKAAAYKMKMDAVKRQGKRTDLTCAPLEHKLEGSWMKDVGFFERTTNMRFCLERRKIGGKVKQRPVICYDDKKESKPVGEPNKKLGAVEQFNEYQDSDFYFIAGCTSGGTPYGITWDQARDKGLLEAEKMKK